MTDRTRPNALESMNFGILNFTADNQGEYYHRKRLSSGAYEFQGWSNMLNSRFMRQLHVLLSVIVDPTCLRARSIQGQIGIR